MRHGRPAQLLDAYRRAASAHGEATVAGDHDAANRHYDILDAVYRELRAREASAQKSLLPLLRVKTVQYVGITNNLSRRALETSHREGHQD
jgi:hypothetical protein